MEEDIMVKTWPTLTASSSGLTPRYFPLPQPTSASTLPAGSADRKWQTRGQGEWRVPLKSEAMASYTRCTYSCSRRAASAWQLGSEGGDGGDGDEEGGGGAPWLSQAEGKAGGRERGGVEREREKDRERDRGRERRRERESEKERSGGRIATEREKEGEGGRER